MTLQNHPTGETYIIILLLFCLVCEGAMLLYLIDHTPKAVLNKVVESIEVNRNLKSQLSSEILQLESEINRNSAKIEAQSVGK